MEGRRPELAAGRARDPGPPRPAGDGGRLLTSPRPRLDDRALLARLVAFDTTSHLTNLPLVEFLADYLDRPGVRVERNDSADGRKANLVVQAGPSRDDRTGVVLSGHTDVVPALEPDWRSDPFQLADIEGGYAARGAADMKGFLALAANRVATFDAAKATHPLVLLFTYDEEIGTLGARRFAETWNAGQLPREVIIGEPTGLRVVRAHKGMLRLRLSFTGQAAHSGYPHLGRNAIEPAARAVVALAELQRQLETERPPHAEQFPEVPFAAINVGTIAGGSAVNVIPDRCEAQLGIRLLPGMSADAFAERVRRTVAAALGDEPFGLEQVSLSPAMIAPPDLGVYRQLRAEMAQMAEHSVMFATDGGWLERAGFHCVLFGPGSIEVAHRANEFVPSVELIRAGEVLDAVIRRRCLAA